MGNDRQRVEIGAAAKAARTAALPDESGHGPDDHSSNVVSVAPSCATKTASSFADSVPLAFSLMT